MPVDISTAELRTMLRAHPGRKRDGTARTRGEQAIRTIMSAITTHYRRVHGVDSASLGDLTWLTSASLSVRSASPTTQPVVGGKAHPDARGAAKKPMAETSMRRLVDNMRSVLLSAAAHINGDPGIPQDEKTALLAAWDAEYRTLTVLVQRLEHDEKLRILSGGLSQRQLDNWIHWPDLQNHIGPLVQEAIAAFGAADVAALRNEPGRFQTLQSNVLLAMHTLLPPVRNDFGGARFVEGTPSEAELRATGSPNYIEVAPDGSLELVINAYKTDGHTAADTYDPAAGDYVLGLDTTLRIPLAPNATLSKFGFKPEVLGTLLGLYRRALQTVFDDRNTPEYLFFSVPGSGNVVPVQPDALGKRVGRRLKTLTGRGPRTQLFRVMFCTWFLNDAEPAPTRAERQLMAEMMMHSEERQLCNYNKRLTRSQVPVQAKRLRTLAPEPEETGEL